MELHKLKEGDYTFVKSSDKGGVVFGNHTKMANATVRSNNMTWDDFASGMKPLIKGKANISYFGIDGIYLYSVMEK